MLINYLTRFRYRNLFEPAMEEHDILKCYCSVDFPSPPASAGGALLFFKKHHYSILANMYDPDWEEDVQLEEILKRVKLILGDEYSDNIVIVYKDHKKVFLENGKFIVLPYRGVFVYDITKINVKVK